LKPGETPHPLLTHPVASQSTNFKLSTSSLSSGENYNGTGFGAVVKDGYGTNYCVGKSVLKFGMESKRECKETDSKKFLKCISETFDEMRDVFLKEFESKGKL
jgi:carnitine O-acetyltransferase